ncbi:pyridoxamine 5'-phosphate oxidase family protein [Arthrobacter roseus]|uniref:pyridoxamine 5'-phosphate oxidase family protein n=1 Tax=Arthrobacter roseus TaxID=136274 RepID=UPI0019630D08|nr:pyridoxamine 5'-phosphate oxidase family protein [Arthrobacter roseus]MBM7847330.1 nitroimidazol reductase NimA-like FMN-containing flavoprotein (pyridoxamine 5'-phosphate oxidase superfamily) [Arthrobacter roseus]
MEAEPTPARILTDNECWAFLRDAPVGRLALCIDGQPEIFPINFVVDHGTIVYRTSEGTKSHAAEKSPAALEADGLIAGGTPGSVEEEGPHQETVWSVVVKGSAATIAVTSELIASVRLPLHPWESGRKDRFMRLVPETISGRAFTPTRGEDSRPTR